MTSKTLIALAVLLAQVVIIGALLIRIRDFGKFAQRVHADDERKIGLLEIDAERSGRALLLAQRMDRYLTQHDPHYATFERQEIA